MTCYYALIYRARGPYKEIFVLTFKAYGLKSHLTSLQCASRLKSFFEKFLSRASCSQRRAVSFRAISCLACQTVLSPRSRLVDFNKFHYNLKVTRGRHEFRHESTGTRARGTKARVLDMLVSIRSLNRAMESPDLALCINNLFCWKYNIQIAWLIKLQERKVNGKCL